MLNLLMMGRGSLRTLLLTLGSGGVGKSGLRAEIIQIIIKLKEFFLNPALILSQRDQMPQQIFPMLTKSMFQNIKQGIKWSSVKSPSIQVLHQPIRGALVCADRADAEGGRGSKIMENLLT